MAKLRFFLFILFALSLCLFIACDAQTVVTNTVPNVVANSASTQADVEKRLVLITKELRCLVCQNQTIADSQAELALELKSQVRQQLEHGASDQDVIDYMVQRYGDFILYRPPFKPITLLLWLGPFLLLVISLYYLYLKIRQLRIEGDDVPELATGLAVQDFTANQSSLKQLWQPRWTMLLLGIGVTVVAVLIYAMIGTPAGIDPAQKEPAAGAPTPQQIEGMVNNLAERLKSAPEDADGWAMLARSYETLHRFDLAADAYRHLIKLTPRNADAYNDYAVTLAMSQGQSLSGEPEKLIHQALIIDPGNIQSLALLGSAAFERKEYANAIIPWKKILKLIPVDSSMSLSISDNIDKAQALAKK
jgi:cytochrome c-type biogenesis protein CcmH